MKSSSQFLQQMLKDMTPQERKEAILMLAVIGLETCVKGGPIKITGGTIKTEHARSYSQLLKQQNSIKQIEIREEKSGKEKIHKQTRRHDGLLHYPFVDEFGSVTDVLKEVNDAAFFTENINGDTDPVLIHTMKKAFEEFKIGNNGLRASDIPPALKMIRSQKFDHPFLSISDSDCETTNQALSSHKLISFDQWKNIVQSRVQNFLRGNDRLDSTVPEPYKSNDLNEDESLSDNDSLRICDDEEWVYPTFEDHQYQKPKGQECNNHFHRSKTLNPVHPRPATQKFPSHEARNSVEDASRARAEALQKEPVSATNNKHFKLPTGKGRRSKGTKLSETRARIAADKRHAQRVRASRQEAALSVIASSRFSYLSEDGHKSSPKPPVKELPPQAANISSGSAALDIANAFLTSSLGQELIKNSRHETKEGGQANNLYSDIGSYEAESQEEEFSEYNIDSAAEMQSKPEQSFTLPGNGGGRKINNRSERDKKGSDYYADNWRNTRGGWVADFGAPHTHALSVANVS